MSSPETPPQRSAADLKRRMIYVPPDSPASEPAKVNEAVVPAAPVHLETPAMPESWTLPASTPETYNLPGALHTEFAGDDEVGRLRADYQELLTAFQEAEKLIEIAVEQEKELEDYKSRVQELNDEVTQLTEMTNQKSSALAELRDQHDSLIQELERELKDGAKPAARPAVNLSESGLEQMSLELEQERVRLDRERKKLDEERRMFRDEQETDMQQLRQEEARMSRERAMMARQEMALKQLNDDIKRQLTLLQGGGGALQETLKQFQRRQLDANSRQAAPAHEPPPPGIPHNPATPAPPAGPSGPPKGRDSGLLRRFFGQGGNK